MVAERAPLLAPLLELRGLCKRFGGVTALADVDLLVAPGEVLGVMGDNGAGKSTLLGIVAGSFRPSAGSLRLDGRPARFAGPAAARAEGIEVVYQDLALCENLSATENVFLGRELVRRVLGVVPVLDHAAMRERTRALFEELQSDTRPDQRVRDLSGGQRQAVAIARTRLSEARLVLMDEPTAAISVRQVEQVLELIRRLRDSGVAVILVSHRMQDVFAVSDRVTVLRRGRKVADKAIARSSPEEITGLITGAIEAA
jgi:simple sugar transport system ATP-binding protein